MARILFQRSYRGILCLWRRDMSTNASDTSGKLVDGLLQYVFNGTGSSTNQAVDIINSGLSAQQDPKCGIGSARCYFTRFLRLHHAPFCLLHVLCQRSSSYVQLSRFICSDCIWEWQRWRGTEAIG